MNKRRLGPSTNASPRDDEVNSIGTVRLDASIDTCEQRAHDVLDHLLGGRLGTGVQVDCSDAADMVRARADVVLPSWFPAVIPDWTFTITGSAVKEREP